MSEAAILAAKLEAEGQKLGSFLAGLSEADWGVEIYTEGETWTVRNVLAHLVTAERAFVRLFDEIRKDGTGVSEDFVIDRYNASQQRITRGFNSRELLQQYLAGRAAMVSFVLDLSDSDLGKQGRHPFLGVSTLREMVKMIYIHNQTHYRDIRRALKGEAT
jgi:hypothetical protein